MVIFAAFGEDTAGTFYFDDVEQEGASGNCETETEENIDPAAGDINWTFKDLSERSMEVYGVAVDHLSRRDASDFISALKSKTAN